MRYVLILAACLASCATVPADGGQGGLDPALAPAARFEMRRFDETVTGRLRFGSGLTQPVRAVVRSEAEWAALWRRITTGQSPALLPPVDFRREMLLVAAMGARPTGGYTVRIVSAIDRGAEIEARAVQTAPGRRCGAIAAVTEPADVVRVTRSDKPVRWVVRAEITQCP